MSVTVSTPQQICTNPLNTSKSKFLYSFPKSPKLLVTKPPCNHAFYDLPPVRMTRTTALGYGTKYDFTKNVVSNPAPNTYKLQDEFDSKTKKKGYSFGLSREAMAVTGSQFVGDKTSPGPGAYDTRETNKTVHAYTFKGRTTAPEGLTTVRIVPGPGTYPAYDTLRPNGKYFVSKFKNSGAGSFAPLRSTRFPATKDANFPAPGSYDLIPTISPKGSYYLSKFHSSGVRSFGHSTRNATQSSFQGAPGPGSYRIPSDFGYYESKHSKTQANISIAKSPERDRNAETLPDEH
jgi:hypothetical protein